jgi:hypothetical protein
VWGGAIDNLIALGIPTAIGIALLRYRLYDIDRLINRTLVYGSLTAILGLGYAVVVVLGVPARQPCWGERDRPARVRVGEETLLCGDPLGELLGQDTSLAVAGATLAMAAVFQPLRRRTQAMVDRRFNRRRHDAARPSRPSTPTFDQIDLDTLSAELVAVVDQTMDRPRVSLWLQRPDRQALSLDPPMALSWLRGRVVVDQLGGRRRGRNAGRPWSWILGCALAPGECRFRPVGFV